MNRQDNVGSGALADSSLRRIIAICFFLSGATSLLNQLIWMRKAMAHFGVTTVSLSIVLSIFMLGLALGTWLAGRRPLRRPLLVYGGLEAMIGVSAVAAPALLALGQQLFLQVSTPWASPAFSLLTGAWVCLALLPWTIAMGATVPVALAALKRPGHAGHDNFSFLYAANVLGATCGVLCTALVLIESLGFRQCMYLAAAVNFLVAAIAWWAASRVPGSAHAEPAARPAEAARAADRPQDRFLLLVLFTSGLVSMALEVIWMRLYKPYLANYVYSYSLVLAVYLASSFAGTWFYRRRQAASFPVSTWLAFGGACILTLAFTHPFLMNHPSLIRMLQSLRVIGIVPCCFLMGWITPQLVDLYSAGEPGRAGRAYAMNILGSIIGPLLASFLLLPWCGERGGMAALASLVLLTALAGRRLPGFTRLRWSAALALVILFALLFRTPYDHFLSSHPKARLVRDHAATTVAFGKGMDRQLVIDGTGMTVLTPITKLMVHLPLAMRPEPPRRILIICFGMGTTFRSALSWTDETRNVELVPGVLELFDFFHDDADTIRREHGAGMIADDGRRYLDRTRETYDLITIDIAPPCRSTGASLLLSREFLALVRARLTPDGVLAHWLPPSADPESISGMLKGMQEVFPYVRIYRSQGRFGFHFIASLQPLEDPKAEILAARLAEPARRDLLQWQADTATPASVFEELLVTELTPAELIALAPNAPTLTDDRPVNEYFLLRWLGLIDWRN